MVSGRIDLAFLNRFEQGLDPETPHRSAIPARIIGYGEISTIFEIDHSAHQGLAYKRLPIFRTEQEMNQYEELFVEYNRLLQDDIGIRVPGYALARISPVRGNMVMYTVQEKLPAESIGNRLIRHLDNESLAGLMTAVLKNMKKVWSYNSSHGRIRVGIDGQISNWAIAGTVRAAPSFREDIELVYIDTGTPLIQKDGIEQLNAELFLRSVPSFLVRPVKWLFLKDILTRYYDFHLVVVDLIANFYKEQRSDVIPLLIETANSFFAHELGESGLEPITAGEVRSYYRQDAFIWRLYLASRKLDRVVQTRILRRHYPYILPGRIQR